ncbi:MAG TPA: sensor histidine kinase [Gemmatimonadaceae bacterium]|jgi:signal transduction histidine kinase|nr:sensor histidine kinase [Gemmatimonadaceae bacterium]
MHPMNERPGPESPATPSVAQELAARLRAGRIDIVQRWLDRISARVSVTPNRIFPTDQLLNHVPLLVDGIADYLADERSELGSETPVVAKAMELGRLRHEQGFDAYQILKEFELLGNILFTHLGAVVDDIGVIYSGSELTAVCQRMANAIELIRQATMTHFLRLAGERVHEREDRLRRFNRMVSHELKNRTGALRGAAQLLAEPWLEPGEQERFVRMINENADGLQHVLENLESLSRIEADTRQRRNVLLPDAVQEVVRQLRSAAEARAVKVEIDPSLPSVEVDAAAVELCLGNYVSNAIKYSDAGKSEHWVQISAQLEYDVRRGGHLVVCVRDNGIGVPPSARSRLFQQFYRAHSETVTGIEGTGLGLSIVRETVEALGGGAWAQFPPQGAAFFFSLPSRRAEDAAAAGTRRPIADSAKNEA